MRMSYVPKHSQDHANSEYTSDVGSLPGAEFIGNKDFPHSLTKKHRHSPLYITKDSTK